MSLTGLAWLLLFFGLMVASLRRPVYACCAYLMTVLANPMFWWWGTGVISSITIRWSLLGAALFLIVLLTQWSKAPALTKSGKKYATLLVFYAVNAFVVHQLFAANPVRSWESWDMLWKSALLSILIYFSIQTIEDLQIFLTAIVIGCGYVGYEVVVNDAGTFMGGRLEGINFPAAQGSNAVAAVMSMALPLVGYFIVCGPKTWHRVLAFLSAPLILDTIFRCNSRGAYLGIIATGIWLLYVSKGRVRIRAAKVLAGGAIAVLLLANNEAILERFVSIFVESSERDGAASERILYWTSALQMISDYPLGSGGEAAFRSERGLQYILHFRPNREYRSVHNGFLDIAAGWGIQGFAIYFFIIAVPSIALWRATRVYTRLGYESDAFLGAAIQAMLIGQLVCTVFTNVLDGEWYLWITACSLAYARLASLDADIETELEEEADTDFEPVPEEPVVAI
tara:strand:+ start:65169 stop:66530 length:1362 start_codon:yes stop_codon:yes gene_type:complete